MYRNYMTRHEPSLGPFARVLSDTLAASKKTSATPRLCFELHSRYLDARTRRATAKPSSYCTGCIPYRCSRSLTDLSSRRSHFRATSTSFTPGQYSNISSSHLVSTFSNDVGLSTEKHIITTCVSAYERERSLSNSS